MAGSYITITALLILSVLFRVIFFIRFKTNLNNTWPGNTICRARTFLKSLFPINSSNLPKLCVKYKYSPYACCLLRSVYIAGRHGFEGNGESRTLDHSYVQNRLSEMQFRYCSLERGGVAPLCYPHKDH